MLFFFPRDVLDEIWDLVGSVSEGVPTYFFVWLLGRHSLSKIENIDFYVFASPEADSFFKELNPNENVGLLKND